AGYWEFPGGKVEKHETSERALIRELSEELGIVANQPQHLFDHQHTYPDKTVQLAIWLVENFNEEPQARENQMLAWVDVSEIVKLRLLEGNWPIITKLQALLSSN